MSLREDRVLFTTDLLPPLIEKALMLGFEVAFDFVKRCEDCPVGKANSLHKRGLAVDLLLYRDLDGDGDQDYIRDTETHRPLGEYWESLHPRARWGGRYNDGNHYELVPEGE